MRINAFTDSKYSLVSCSLVAVRFELVRLATTNCINLVKLVRLSHTKCIDGIKVGQVETLVKIFSCKIALEINNHWGYYSRYGTPGTS